MNLAFGFEVVSVLVQVKSPQPLIDGHILYLGLRIQNALSFFYNLLSIVSVLEEESLEFRHSNFQIWKSFAELLCFFSRCLWEELHKHFLHLVHTSIV